MENLKFGDKVYHTRYKNGFVESVEKDMVWVVFDNCDKKLDDSLIQVPYWSLEKIGG